MDWRKEIDQQLLMPIGKLIACLAFEAIRESPPSADEVLSGTVLSTSDMLGRHQRSILELLEKGCLLDKIQILRGGKQVLHDLQEVRSTIADIRSRAYRIALYRELDPGLPQVPDTSYTIATHEMAEISLSEQAMALEVVPGDVVRWMNSTHEGQILLPASLRAYLAANAEQEPTATDEVQTEAAPPQTPVEAEANGGETYMDTPASGEQKKYVPRDLWAQKPLQQVCDDMRVASFEDDAIAYALFHWRGIKNMTEIGTILRGNDISSSGREKHARKVLKKTENRYYTD